MCIFCVRVPAVKDDHLCRNCRETYRPTIRQRARSSKRKSLLGDAILVVHWKGVVLKQIRYGPTVEVNVAPERLPKMFRGALGLKAVLDLNVWQPDLDRETVKRYKAVFKPYLVRAGVA